MSLGVEYEKWETLAAVFKSIWGLVCWKSMFENCESGSVWGDEQEGQHAWQKHAIFIGEEQTNMAAATGAQIWIRKTLA